MNKKHREHLDLTGHRYNRWSVESYAKYWHERHYWNCVCKCGNTALVSTGNLRSGTSKSCGCLMRELASSSNITHGMVNSREWKAWSLMKTRCSNPHRPRADRYIGRGIRVCDRWLHSFENFYADMGKCPKGHALDRIDNDGDYSPENCRWATMTQQARNKSCNRLIEYQGETKCMQEWSQDKRCRVGFWGFRSRLDRGWTIEEALSVKKNTKIRYYRESI